MIIRFYHFSGRLDRIRATLTLISLHQFKIFPDSSTVPAIRLSAAVLHGLHECAEFDPDGAFDFVGDRNPESGDFIYVGLC
jgi:hypothetical protein